MPLLSVFVSFCSRYAHLASPHSFPTRRSSDLIGLDDTHSLPPGNGFPWDAYHINSIDLIGKNSALVRSEEHTSELQSRRDLVCRLLLEKKNCEKFVVRRTRPERLAA